MGGPFITTEIKYIHMFYYSVKVVRVPLKSTVTREITTSNQEIDVFLF